MEEIKRVTKKIAGILLTLFLFLNLAPSGSQTASMDFPDTRNELPKPILDDHPEWVNMYWKAWEIACSNVQYGTAANGFVPAYLDEGYDRRIYQFDTIFMMMFTKYGVPALLGILIVTALGTAIYLLRRSKKITPEEDLDSGKKIAHELS